MPELPEVQTIVDDLNKKIKGDTIVDFESFWKKAIKNGSFDDFKKNIVGQKIVVARRIGKNIFIDLSNGKTIYIHLKMTGHLLVKSNVDQMSKKEKGYFDDKVNQYIRHIFYLKSVNGNDKTLEFSDLRKFGKIVLTDTEKLMELPEISKLGIDAMSVDFTFEVFEKILEKKRRRLIGAVLMEQDLIAGIGNIYRSEILFEAGIMPKRKVDSLSDEDVKRIYDSIKSVLKKAIKLRGTSDSDYRDTSGAPGKMSEALNVYNREGEKCEKCDTIVKREKLGQRSVFYCASCQK